MTKLHPDDKAQQATHAFERYNLVTAPVVDADDKLLGRVTVNEVMDFIREESENEALNLAGLREEEDLFAPVWKSIKNRLDVVSNKFSDSIHCIPCNWSI